jgi:hypothetical protein
LRLSRKTKANRNLMKAASGRCSAASTSWKRTLGCEKVGNSVDRTLFFLLLEVSQKGLPETTSPWSTERRGRSPELPKIKCSVERFNRTIQEEFIDHHEELLLTQLEFNYRLIPGLIWYSAERPHCACLNLVSNSCCIKIFFVRFMPKTDP